MKKLKLIAFYTLLFFSVSITAYGQGPGFEDDVEDEVPLDGGLSLLVVAGVGYGMKKITDHTLRKQCQ